MSEALHLEGVSKRYVGHLAVDNLDLVVPRGLIWGILGPNGAGKSTTLRMVMGIIARDSGSILLNGKDPERDREVLRTIGYLPEERGLYRKMKVLEVIEFFSTLKGLTRRNARTKALGWLDRMGLAEWKDARVETLSKGMQQKVQFIATVLHEPDILILDEPFSGLDPINQEVLRDTMLDARQQGRTVILSTHNMEQAEEFCDGISIIAQGRKIVDGRLREVRRSYRRDRYRVEFDDETPAGEAYLSSSPHVASASRARGGWEIDLSPGSTSANLLSALSGSSTPIRKFEHLEPTLHEIFIQEVGASAGTPGRNRGDLHA